jgi:cob(I)alamin adenosyltransferase
MPVDMKIYTKKGDDGSTSLLGGQRVKKSHARLDSYGTLDELNSALGVAVATLKSAITKPQEAEFAVLQAELLQIQNLLFNIGSALAVVDEAWKAKIPKVNADHVICLESRIDEWTAILPPLKNFILPGGHIVASHLHLARAISRRAERLAVALHEQNPVEVHILSYLNRLSDFLFVAARFVNLKFGISDIEWDKK